MIANVKTNGSFGQTTEYVVDKEKAQIIGGNAGQTPSQLVAEFQISAHLNPRVKNPCYHLMLSLPQPETLSDEQFAEMGTKFFASMVVLSRLTGEPAQITSPKKRIKEAEVHQEVEHFLEDEIHQYSYFIARHQDRDHQHIHIVASRINEMTGKAIQTWQNYPKGEYAARILEKEFNLTSVLCSWEGKTKALTRSQRDRVEKDGLPGAEIIRRAIDTAIMEQPTLPELIERLAHQGIIAEVSYHSTGKVRGIRYSILVEDHSSQKRQSERSHLANEQGSPSLKRLTITGFGLNRHKYSFFKLQSELGVSYIPERDDEYLKKTMGKAQDLARESVMSAQLNDAQLLQLLQMWQQWQKKKSKPNESEKEAEKSKKMAEIAKYFEYPAIQKRIERIRQGYTLYGAGKTILKYQGQPQENTCNVEGKTYRIALFGRTLTLTYQEQNRVVYRATDNREQGGIIEIEQLDLNAAEIEAIECYAGYLEQIKQQQSQKERGFSL